MCSQLADSNNITRWYQYNILVLFGGRVCQQTVDISVDINRLVCLYKADYMPLKKNEYMLTCPFSLTFFYIDDIVSLSNSNENEDTSNLVRTTRF